MTLTKLQIKNGTYFGTLACTSKPPEIHLMNGAKSVAVANLKKSKKNHYTLEIQIPAEVLDEGNQILTIINKDTKEVLDHIAIATGQAREENLSLRLAHLEAELDLLKSILRKMNKN